MLDACSKTVVFGTLAILDPTFHTTICQVDSLFETLPGFLSRTSSREQAIKEANLGTVRHDRSQIGGSFVIDANVMTVAALAAVSTVHNLIVAICHAHFVSGVE